MREELREKFLESDAKPLHLEIMKRSSGDFQWASLVVPKILSLKDEGCSLEKIQERLQEIPVELSGLYQEILGCKADTNDGLDRSLQLMQWICLAERSLSMDKLRSAIAFDEDARYKSLHACLDPVVHLGNNEDIEVLVKHLSGGLANIKEQGGKRVTQFIHQWVKDCLIQGGPQSLENVFLKKREGGLIAVHPPTG